MVFEISIEENNTVFMTKRRNSVDAAIVMVEGEKLFKLWQNEPYHPEPQLAFGTVENWKSDYKYRSAGLGFSHGKPNPVAVAKVVVNEAKQHEPVYEYKFKFFRKQVGYKTTKVPYIAFDDGITRSIWLMANQAKAFPVECSADSALLLNKLAGVKGSEIIWV